MHRRGQPSGDSTNATVLRQQLPIARERRHQEVANLRHRGVATVPRVMVHVCALNRATFSAVNFLFVEMISRCERVRSERVRSERVRSIWYSCNI